MKITNILAILAIGTIGLQAGAWSTISGMGMDERKIETAYTIDTPGYNPRVYEFKTKTNPNVLCVVIFGNNEDDSPALQCVKTK